MKQVFVLWMMVCCGWAQSNRAPNTLTPEERKEGFTLLFDGKSLAAWDVRPGLEKVWKVADGVIKNDSSSPGATLLSKQEFANYVLKAEFRAHPEINSGLMLRQSRKSGGQGMNCRFAIKKATSPAAPTRRQAS